MPVPRRIPLYVMVDEDFHTLISEIAKAAGVTMPAFCEGLMTHALGRPPRGVRRFVRKKERAEPLSKPSA